MTHSDIKAPVFSEISIQIYYFKTPCIFKHLTAAIFIYNLLEETIFPISVPK